MSDLTFYVVTYNIASNSPVQPLNDLLQWKNRTKKQLPDFCFFGLQEINSQPQNLLLDLVFDDPWTAAIRDVLSGFDYVKIRTVKMVGLLLNVFCKRKHVPYLKEMESLETRTGLLGLWGNKGAVSFSFKFCGITVCCVNCHLSAHEGYLKNRINDFHKIIENQRFGLTKRRILNHDYVFWFGDLNFRLDNSKFKSAEEIEHIINNAKEKKNAATLSDIWLQDELTTLLEKSKFFTEFIEALPMFPPTYRYIVGSCSYDLNRRPAWTDRILYKKIEDDKFQLNVLSYNYINSITLSDHKPVYGESCIQIPDDYSNDMVFPIFFQPLRKWKLDVENEVKLRICNYNPCVNDWIGIFPEEYTSLSDYVSYVYLPSETIEFEEFEDDYEPAELTTPGYSRVKFLPEIYHDGANRVCLKFSETSILNPGTYRLIYFSSIENSILGISNPFTAAKYENVVNTSHEIGW